MRGCGAENGKHCLPARLSQPACNCCNSNEATSMTRFHFASGHLRLTPRRARNRPAPDRVGTHAAGSLLRSRRREYVERATDIQPTPATFTARTQHSPRRT
jgi:hypothetical protein